jgi:raffinose/stachyose/melibiose transport system permease protein
MTTKYTALTVVREVGMIQVTLVFFIPIYILLNVAFKLPNDLSPVIQPPAQPTIQNVLDAVEQGGLLSAIGNSLYITVFSVLLIVIISSLAAYPLARVGAWWSKWTFGIVMAGLLLPMQLALVPLFQQMGSLGLLGTRTSLLIYFAGHQVPFATFLYVMFMRKLSVDYEEAAKLDGASPIRVFLHVVFPLMRPVTGTVVILNAISVWNDFLTPLLYLSGSGNETAPVALYQFVGQYVSRWNLVFGGLLLTMIPILLVYFIMQKRIIQGFAGGMKG